MTSKAPTKPGPPLRIPRPQPGVGVVGTYQSVPPGYHLDLRADGRATYVLSPAAVDAAGGWRGLTARGTWRSVQGTLEVELTHPGGGAVPLPRPRELSSDEDPQFTELVRQLRTALKPK